MSFPNDLAAERAVLAGIIHYGADIYHEIIPYLQQDTFTTADNTVLFKVLQYVFKQDDSTKIDLPILLSASKTLDEKLDINYIKAVQGLHLGVENIKKLAVKIRKLHIARLLKEQLEVAENKMLGITGDEPIMQIFGLAENPIIDLSTLLNNEDNAPTSLGQNIEEYTEYLANNPVAQMGVSTGFLVYDQHIGGGLRPGTVGIIGARTKIGKSFLGQNIGLYIASNNMPVLNMDTELLKEDHIHRILAKMTHVTINDIETGHSNIKNNNNLRSAVTNLKSIPYFHKSIAGAPFEDQLSIMRRWIMKDVGLNEHGHAKPCVIIYDYLKLMNSSDLTGDMKEYQLLGFMMTALHNFAVKYRVPILAFIQLNRDGINKETTDVVSGSDRIGWLASNVAILKPKSDEEIAQDGTKNGNRKIIVIAARHGGGTDDGDYINYHFTGKYGEFIEGKTRAELKHEQEHTGFTVEDDTDDISL